MLPLAPFNLNQPLALDNSISTIGVIHKLISKINEVIVELNNIDSKANEYTDEQIEILDLQLRSYINELNTITINHFESVEADILLNKRSIENLDLRQQFVEQSLNELQGEFTNLTMSVNTRIQNNFNAMKSYVDLQIQIVKELIDAQNPIIIDCFGKPNKLQTAYNNLFDALMYSNGGGTFEKVLAKIMGFSYSPYVDMHTAQYYTVCTALANTPTSSYINYYLSYSSTSLQISTQKLITFKDLITNIASCLILIYKYGIYMGVTGTTINDFQKALRNSFFASSEYQQVTINPTFDSPLR